MTRSQGVVIERGEATPVYAVAVPIQKVPRLDIPIGACEPWGSRKGYVENLLIIAQHNTIQHNISQHKAQ